MNANNTAILAIDVGNTNIHWSFITEGKIEEFKRNKHTELSLLPWSKVKERNCSVIIAGALYHINEALHTIANDYKAKLIEITIDKQNIIKNTYPSLGIDRVCNLIGAFKSFDNLNSPVIVFDFGTATTITSCDENGDFLGGIIKTGFETELKAISSKTFSLPHVELAKEQKITKLNPLLRNTEDAILHGVIIGQVALIEYYLKLFNQEHSKPKIVFTGGNSEVILRFLPFKPDLYDPHLTLKGIYHCFEKMTIGTR